MRHAAAVALLALAACKPVSNPDQGRYSCASDVDCGKGWECRPQFAGLSRCFKEGDCADEELCDGTDNTCDGRVDETFPEFDAGCPTGVPGVCGAGNRACDTGTVVCVQTVVASAELCNGLDDNCDGRTDETFDFATDSRHCGGCGRACDAGTACAGSRCAEVRCGDGLDNDVNGLTDCQDPGCFALECRATPAPPWFCGALVPPFPDAGADGGLDGGEPDAGTPDAGTPDAGATDGGGTDGGGSDGGDPDGGPPDGGDGGAVLRGCFAPERDCGNGYDDDGDGQADCLDLDCDGLTCASGTLCALRMCPGPG